MKLDNYFSFIRVCPETNFRLTEDEYTHSKGVCPICGNIDDSSFTHSKQLAGKWNRPSLFERVFRRQVAVLSPKGDV